MARKSIMREIFSMDKEWKFHMGEVPFPAALQHQETFNAAKAGGARGAAAPSFDDTGWKLIHIPHDWSVNTDFDANNSLSQGFKK